MHRCQLLGNRYASFTPMAKAPALFRLGHQCEARQSLLSFLPPLWHQAIVQDGVIPASGVTRPTLKSPKPLKLSKNDMRSSIDLVLALPKLFGTTQ